MPKQQTAKQHVVPKFYLRKFTDNEGLLEVFDLQWKKFSGRKNPSAIGYDLYFYAQTTGKPDDVSQEFEELLKSFEDYLSLRYDEICEKILSGARIDEQDRFTISLHACVLWLRGYTMREQINEMSGELLKKMMHFWSFSPNVVESIKKAIRKQEGRELTDEEANDTVEFMRKGEYTIQGDNLTHLSMVGEYQGYTNLFNAQKLRIYIAEGKRRFITSDAPVLELLPKYAREQSFYGWTFLERLHSLPLSSQILVEFHDPQKLSGKPIIRKRIDDDEVAAANARQLDGAHRWCAGVNRDDFYAWQNLPSLPLPAVRRTGRFEESHLGSKVK